jgi:hypothetical protein
MKGVIHQPHFLPWLGYFNKLANCDIFIIQDNVQYRERYFQNRTVIRNKKNECTWLTVPVKHNRNSLIMNVEAANKHWKIKLVNNLFYNYKNEKYFDHYFNELCITIFECNNDLVSINLNLIKYVLKLLDISIIIKKASDYEKGESATENLVKLCQSNGINKYIFGEGGGLKYHGINSFKAQHIETYKQEFKEFHSENNKEFNEGIFNLSILEYLFKIEIEEIKSIVHRKNIIHT